MAHWIIDDKGFGGTTYTCSDCECAFNDLFWDICSTSDCPECGAVMTEDDNVYVKYEKHSRASHSIPHDKQEPTEDIIRFYYCESMDKYLVGKRFGNHYYADVTPMGDLAYIMSRYLPWGQHITDENTAWKEYTYPSEPVEITFEEWIRGFMKQMKSYYIECNVFNKFTKNEIRQALGVPPVEDTNIFERRKFYGTLDY